MSRTVRIRILEAEIAVDAEDSLLRALQFYGIGKCLPEHGFSSLCWNASCHQCLVEIEDQGARGWRFACQTTPSDGLIIRTVPGVLRWDGRLKNVR